MYVMWSINCHVNNKQPVQQNLQQSKR